MTRDSSSFSVDVALIHFPVNNRIGEIIGSAVTNLDLHDIARASRTYGVDTFYVVTPYHDQHELVEEILNHWLTGHGSIVNKKRGEALSLVCLCRNLEEVYEKIRLKKECRPLTLATSARDGVQSVSYDEAREKASAGLPLLLLFGTAWGLADEILAEVDGVLPPISGIKDDYNHLSVRSAVSIILDRLLGQR